MHEIRKPMYESMKKKVKLDETQAQCIKIWDHWRCYVSIYTCMCTLSYTLHKKSLCGVCRLVNIRKRWHAGDEQMNVSIWMNCVFYHVYVHEVIIIVTFHIACGIVVYVVLKSNEWMTTLLQTTQEINIEGEKGCRQNSTEEASK